MTKRKVKPATPPLENLVNKGRHESQCTICAHPKRDDIEQAFINWTSPRRITTEFKVSRDSIYRHAHMFNLIEKRRRNVRAALEKIIEHAGDVEVNAAAVVSAVGALARINAQGKWIERKETVDLNALFDRMTTDEAETYAREGKLPDWFEMTLGATQPDSGGVSDEHQVVES